MAYADGLQQIKVNYGDRVTLYECEKCHFALEPSDYTEFIERYYGSIHLLEEKIKELKKLYKRPYVICNYCIKKP